MDPKQVTIIVPVHNEEESLRDFAPAISDFARLHGFELIFVNDGSSDDSEGILKKLKANYVSHQICYGYGAALKTGVGHATREYVMFVDADGQHRFEDILKIAQIADGKEMVIGERKNLYQMTFHTMIGRIILTGLFNMLTQSNIKDINSGLRLVRKQFFRRYESALPDNFSCTTTLTILAIKFRHGIRFVPIEVMKRKGKSKVSLMKDGLNLIILIIRAITLTDPLAIFLPISVFFIFSSILYGLYVAITQGLGIPVGALILFITGIILFALGIICDQISALRLSILRRDQD